MEHLNRQSNLIFLKILALLSCFMFSCSHAQYEAQPFSLSRKAAVAVLPFNNLTSYPRAGSIVAEVMTVELAKKKEIRVVDHSFVAAALKEKKMKLSRSLAQVRFTEIGNAANAQYILTGNVTEYRYTRGVAEAPAVAFQVKLISTQTGKVVWRGSVSDVSTESIFSRSASLDELTHSVCESLVDYLTVK